MPVLIHQHRFLVVGKSPPLLQDLFNALFPPKPCLSLGCTTVLQHRTTAYHAVVHTSILLIQRTVLPCQRCCAIFYDSAAVLCSMNSICMHANAQALCKVPGQHSCVVMRSAMLQICICEGKTCMCDSGTCMCMGNCSDRCCQITIATQSLAFVLLSHWRGCTCFGPLVATHHTHRSPRTTISLTLTSIYVWCCTRLWPQHLTLAFLHQSSCPACSHWHSVFCSSNTSAVALACLHWHSVCQRVDRTLDRVHHSVYCRVDRTVKRVYLRGRRLAGHELH